MEQQELENLIYESVVRVFKEYGLINEMAKTTKEYKRRAEGLLPQIAENWCLIYFFKRSGLPTSYIEHWGKELLAHMGNLSRLKLKRGDTQDVLYRVWNENDFDTDPKCVELCIYSKFLKEGIDIKKYYSYVNEACRAFVASTREIIWVITQGSLEGFISYIDSIGEKNILE